MQGFRVASRPGRSVEPMRALTLSLLLVSGAFSVARAQPPEADAGVAAEAPCTSAEGCAAKHGRGSVCGEQGLCQPYQDATDLFIAIGLSEPTTAAPEPYKPFLTILPVIGSNPTQGVLAGVAGLPRLYLGGPQASTNSTVSANLPYPTQNPLLSRTNSVPTPP